MIYRSPLSRAIEEPKKLKQSPWRSFIALRFVSFLQIYSKIVSAIVNFIRLICFNSNRSKPELARFSFYFVICLKQIFNFIQRKKKNSLQFRSLKLTSWKRNFSAFPFRINILKLSLTKYKTSFVICRSDSSEHAGASTCTRDIPSQSSNFHSPFRWNFKYLFSFNLSFKAIQSDVRQKLFFINICKCLSLSLLLSASNVL